MTHGAPSLVIGPVEEPRSRSRELTILLIVLSILSVVAIGFVARDLQGASVAPNGQQTSTAVRSAVLDRAAASTQEAFSYAAASIDADLAKAAKNMTPAMAKTYLATLTDQKRSELTSRGQVQTASIVGAGLVSLTSDTARVLELAVTTVTVTGSANQQIQSQRVLVTLRKTNGVWFIDGIEGPF